MLSKIKIHLEMNQNFSDWKEKNSILIQNK